MIIEHIGSSFLYLRYRDENNKLIEKQVQYKPYFWILNKTDSKSFVNYDGRTVYQMMYSDPKHRFELKNSFLSYELDVSLENRYLIDNFPDGLPDYNIRVMHLDIETDMCLDAHRTPKPITAITFHDNYLNQYFTFSWKPEKGYQGTFKDDNWTALIFNSEEDMLDEFKSVFSILNPDLITGWNILNYDIPYIINRHHFLGKDITWISPILSLADEFNEHTKDPIKGRICFDLMYGFQKLHDGDIGFTSLRSVLEDNNAPFQKLTGMDSWRSDFEAFLKYNKRDVEGTVWIDQTFDIVQAYKERQHLAGCKFSDTYYNSSLIDCYFLRYAHKKNIVLPTATKAGEETYTGATIYKPVAGFHENVVVLDVVSMYPSSMIAGNMSFETLVGNPESYTSDQLIKLGNGVCFKKQPEGFTVDILNEIQNYRNYNKKMMKQYPEDSAEYRKYDNKQRVAKFLRNSMYGVFGYKSFRLYRRAIASSITWLSRQAIAHIRKTVEANFPEAEVLYGHTDSVFVKIPDTKLAVKIEETINNSWGEFEDKFNLNKGKYKIEIDKIFSSLLIAGPNMYAGRLEGDTDKLVVKGFMLKKKSASPIVKDLQKTVIEMILSKKDEAEIFSFIREIITKIRTGNCTLDEITIKVKLKNQLDSYKTNPMHVSACKWSNEHLGLELGNVGDVIQMVAVERDAKAIINLVPKNNVIAFSCEDQIKGFTIDYEEMTEKLIRGKIKLICHAMGWNLDSLMKE